MKSNIDIFKVEDRIWDVIAEKFNTTKNRIDEDAILLQEWLKTQLHLPQMLDFHTIRNFLLLNKGSIELTKQKIDNYYTVRSKVKEVCDEMNPKNPYRKKLKDLLYCAVYPKLTDDMYRICYLKIKNENLLESHDPVDIIKKLFTIQELRLRQDVTFGDIFVFDGKGFNLVSLLKITPTRAYDWLIEIYQKVFSLRIKAVYVLNMPPFAYFLLTLAKSLIKPKIFQRIRICKDIEEVKEIIPLKLLPKDFGGEGFSLDELEEALETKYDENSDLFDRLEKMKVDESVRPEKLQNNEMEVYGNFKQLTFD